MKAIKFSEGAVQIKKEPALPKAELSSKVRAFWTDARRKEYESAAAEAGLGGYYEKAAETVGLGGAYETAASSAGITTPSGAYGKRWT